MSRWPKPYEELTSAMLELRARFPNSALLGASIVHPRHSIPAEHLKLLTELRDGAPFAVPSFSAITAKAAVCFASAVVDTFVIVALRCRFHPGSARPADVVMKTWVPGSDALAKPADFYYGSLFDQLRDAGARPVLLAGDGRSDDGRLISKLKSLGLIFGFAEAALVNGKYFPETLLVPVWGPLKAFVAQVRLSLKLRAWVASLDSGLSILKRLTCRAILDVLRPYTTKNLMHGYSARAAVRRWRPKAVVTFYEGQPWEKVFWRAVKTADPAVTLIGYQHTVVMEHSFALTRPARLPGETPAPDVVLCTGSTTQKMMEPGHGDIGTRFSVFGSYRRAAGGSAPLKPRPELKTILVLPEGILSEAIAIFDFAMELAQRLPDHKLLFRCHPVLPFGKVEPHLKMKAAALPNIEVSRNPKIETDYERASALLYRGSSAALYAVLAGLKPFCWRDPDAPNIDPLCGLTGWRIYVLDSAEAAREISTFSAKGRGAAPEWEKAADFVDNYTRPAAENFRSIVESAAPWIKKLEAN